MAIAPFNYGNPQTAPTASGGSIKPFNYQPYTAPVSTAPQQSFFGKLGSDFLTMGQNVITAATNAPAPKSLDMQASLNAGWDTISNTVQDTAKRITDAGATLNSNASALDKVTAEGRVALGLVNTAFLGITAPLTAARGIPVVGYVADGVSNFFGALGAGGSGYADTAIDALPFSDKTKETIRPLAEEVGALIAQTKVGEVTGHTALRLVDKSKELVTAVHEGVQEAKTHIETASSIENAKPEAAKIPQFDYTKTAAEQHTAYAKSQGYEPYTPNDQLPVIDAGKAAKDTLPTIQTEAPTNNKLGDLTIEPIKNTPTETVSTPKEGVPSPYQEAAPATTETTQSEVSPIKTEPGVSKIGKSIEAKAVEARLTTGFDKTALHEGTSFPEQAKLGTEEVAKGDEHINSIISGETPLPDRLQPAGFIAAVEEHLAKNPNVEMQYRLANSKIVTETSRQASGLSIARMRVQDSATAKLQEIRQAREAKVKDIPKRTTTTRSSVKSEVKKVNLTAEDLGKIDKFIDSILC